MSHSIPNAPKEWRNNHASGNARVQYGDVINNLFFTPLDRQREHEDRNLSQLEDRTDEACRWITKIPAFQDWLAGRDPQSLVLLGPLGFGKTFTIAFVVQYLRDGDFASDTPTTGTRSITAASSSQPRQNVYSYYCKDDGTAGQALNAFRSLFSQLLKDHNHLYDSWVREQEKKGHLPTSSPNRLKDLLIELVTMLPQPTFLIIDALDECLLRDRRVLLDFLEQVCGRTTSTRVLTSARASQSDLSEKLFPKKAVPICSWEFTLPQRDRCIAEFLVKHHMSHVSEDEDVRRLLVKELASGMQGCAMWARMTLEYLVTRRCTSVDTIQSFLDKNELPKPLTELFLGVFENVTAGDDVCKLLLARSLELIAGAQRRLHFHELLYALSLYIPQSKGGVSRAVKDLAELKDNLRREVDEERIRQLLRPFADLEPTVGFVHQSLKEAVLEFPALTDAGLSRQQGWTGVGGIEGAMLRTCVDYLLLDDFNWSETVPSGGRMSQVHQEMWDVHQRIMQAPQKMRGNSLIQPPVPSNTDPFGAFYLYAALHWSYHLDSAPVDFSLDDVLKLASPTSARYRAWTLEFLGDFCQESSSAVTVTLRFLVRHGSVSMLNQLLDRLALNVDGDITSVNVAEAAATAAISVGDPGKFRAVMNHRSTAMASQTVKMVMLKDIVEKWKLRGTDRKEWTRLITDLFDTLVSGTIPSPNYLLRDACWEECIPAIEKLFERAKADPVLQKELMNPTGPGGMNPLDEVVVRGDVSLLRCLCQQDGIEAWLSNGGSDYWSILGRYCNLSPKVEILELLLDKFPCLLSERREVEETLVKFIICSRDSPDRVETAKLILKHTQATSVLVDVDELLACATWTSWPDMCQILIVDAHADARTVVKRSNSGRLELKGVASKTERINPTGCLMRSCWRR